MNPLDLFDLHCDTASKLFEQDQPLFSNRLHVALDKSTAFRRYVQTMAVWSNNAFSDEDCWKRFLKIQDNLKKELSKNGVILAKDGKSLKRAAHSGKRTAILAVEDARLLAGDLTRIAVLYRLGVRFLTLTWAGMSVIGGAHDTNESLTPFGRRVAERCFEIGIVPDISHASRKVTAEILTMAKEYHRPVVATHSNAYAVHPHTRNLTNVEFSAIAESGGLVGISLAPQHLTNGECDTNAVIAHIKHYLSLGGENTLCLGCDFDGIDKTPKEISALSSLPRLADALLDARINEQTVHKIFFENAYGFAVNNI